jgi:hypothetical protein
MRNSTKFAFTTLAATVLFGTAGAVGTSAATADTLEHLNPQNNFGAHCVVVDDDDNELLLFTPNECLSAEQDIAAEERREERKEDRKEERQDAQDASRAAVTE